jgi:hypothetical protein
MADLHKRGSYTFYDKNGMLEYFVADGTLEIENIEHGDTTTTLTIKIVEFKEDEENGELQDPEA